MSRFFQRRLMMGPGDTDHQRLGAKNREFFIITHAIKRSNTLKAAYGVALLLLSVLVPVTISQEAKAATAGIDLGSASSFVVLAGSGITNTGATFARGSKGTNFGSSPTPAFTGAGQVAAIGGTKYLVDGTVTRGAKTDLHFAYADAAGRTMDSSLPMEIGSETLTSGVHNSASSIGITGTLTLDGQGNPGAVFIFQAGSTLITAVNSKVVLINGAKACNVFWQVGSSATFGVGSNFSGQVLAYTSITANTGAQIKGQLLAKNGAVTLDANTFVNDSCSNSSTSSSPSSPQFVSALSGQDKTTISWSAPSDTGGSAITGYTARAKTQDGTNVGTCTTVTTSCEINGLTNGVAYLVTVTAANGMGSSTPSAAVKVVPTLGANTNIGTITTGAGPGNISLPNAGAPINVSYPTGALPAGTVIKIDRLSDTSRANSLVPGDKSVLVNLLVDFSGSNGTPVTANGLITVKLTDPAIKKGARIYGLVGQTVTDLGVATEDGSATVSIAKGSEIVVALTSPDSPTGLTATTKDSDSVTVAWSAPAGNGGSLVTAYVVTASSGESCVTSATSCIITLFNTSTVRTFTVRAINSIGVSAAPLAGAAVAVGANTNIGSITAGAGEGNVILPNAGAPINVSYPAGALPNGTVIKIDRLSDTTRVNSLVPGDKSVLVHKRVELSGPNGTGPVTANGPITVKINNPAIKKGARILGLVGQTVTDLGVATEDGSATVSITKGSEIVVALTSPDSPTGLTAKTDDSDSVTVAWSAPAGHGGSPVTGYVATASTGESCVTSVATCTITGLSPLTVRTFTVRAINSIGMSAKSLASAFNGSVEATGVVNAGSFNNYVAVYALGYKGSTITWKIAGVWFKTLITSDFQVFQRPTIYLNYDVKVDIFIDGVKKLSRIVNTR
jgi:hypothetical protein